MHPKSSKPTLRRGQKPVHAVDVVSALSLIALRIAPLPVDGKIIGFDFVCPFLSFTGLPCPFCGLTRSLIHSAHFQFETAWRYHALGLLFFAFLVISSTRLLMRALPDASIILPLSHWRDAASSHFMNFAFSGLKISRRIAFIALLSIILALWVARLTGFLPLVHGKLS